MQELEKELKDLKWDVLGHYHLTQNKRGVLINTPIGHMFQMMYTKEE